MWLLSAGAREGDRFVDYARHVHGFDWAGFYTSYDGAAYFQWLREELSAFADIVLIDSRTGVTEMSGVCTRELADLVIALTAPNEANLTGVVRMARWFLDPQLPSKRGNRPLRTIVVPSRVDGRSEKAELKNFQCRFFEEVDTLKELDRSISPEEWWRLQIGYYSYYSFHERIVTGNETELEYLRSDLARLAEHIGQHLVAHSGASLLERPLNMRMRVLIQASGTEADVLAESAFRRIPESLEREALSFLARLVHLAPAGDRSATTLSPVQLPAAPLEQIDTQGLFFKLLNAGLLSTTAVRGSPPHAQLAGYAHPQRWRRFAEYLESEQEFLLWRQQVEQLRAEWEGNGRSDHLLLTGQTLTLAQDFAVSRATELSADELSFVKRSLARHYQLQEDHSRLVKRASAADRITRRWILFGAIGVTGTIAILTLGIPSLLLPEPIAQFSCDSYEGTAPLTVTCYNESSNAKAVTWDFGDGTKANNAAAPEVAHIFSPQKDQRFSITLTALRGNSSSAVTRVVQVKVPEALSKPFTLTLTAVSNKHERTTRSCPFSLTNDSHPSLLRSSTAQFAAVCAADPGFKITSAAPRVTSSTRAANTTLDIIDNGATAKLTTYLTSGPQLDRYRGWLRGEILLQQERTSEVSTTKLVNDLEVTRLGRYPLATSSSGTTSVDLNTLKSITLEWAAHRSGDKGSVRFGPSDPVVKVPKLGVELSLVQGDTQMFLDVLSAHAPMK